MRLEFSEIADRFLDAKKEPLKAHPVAQTLSKTLPADMRLRVDSKFGKGFKISGSPGQGNWAGVPWVAVFNPAITTNATYGYYVVYLFSADMKRLYLSLNQGTTAVHDEFKKGYRSELKRRAGLAISRIGSAIGGASTSTINLSGKGLLPEGYEAGHICGHSYDTAALPDDVALEANLFEMLAMYLNLMALGGLADLDGGAADGEFIAGTIDERRRYRFHRTIERNPETSKKVKGLLGYVCQGCNFDFGDVYGEFGNEYIEAHHLIPMSSLPHDQIVSMDPMKDFAVLCANCHRMMHRKNGPTTIDDLRTIPGVKKLAAFLNK